MRTAVEHLGVDSDPKFTYWKPIEKAATVTTALRKIRAIVRGPRLYKKRLLIRVMKLIMLYVVEITVEVHCFVMYKKCMASV